jgi:hypothetical protein
VELAKDGIHDTEELSRRTLSGLMVATGWRRADWRPRLTIPETPSATADEVIQ